MQIKEIKINILIFLEDVVLLTFMKIGLLWWRLSFSHSKNPRMRDGSIANQESHNPGGEWQVCLEYIIVMRLEAHGALWIKTNTYSSLTSNKRSLIWMSGAPQCVRLFDFNVFDILLYWIKKKDIKLIEGVPSLKIKNTLPFFISGSKVRILR